MTGQNSLELINQLSKENLDQYCNKEDLELLILNILNIDRNFLYRENPALNQNQTILLKKCIARRNLGEPLADILGNKGFWNINLLINQNVLVPRPETELLVEKLLSFYVSRPLKLHPGFTPKVPYKTSLYSNIKSFYFIYLQCYLLLNI